MTKELQGKKPEENEDDDIEMVEVSGEEETSTQEAAPEKAEKPADRDEADEDDDDDDDDRRIAEANDDESGEDSEEERRARRREQKRIARAKRRAYAERDKAMIAALEQQNNMLLRRMEMLEGRTLQRDAAEVDSRINEAADQYRYAERVLQDAVARGDGETVTKALRARDEAAMRVNELRSVRSRISEAPPQSEGPSGPDPRVVANARSWFEDNDWVDPNGRDVDSAIVLAIDRKLAEQGLDPTTDDYWDELSEQVRKRFPDKYGSVPGKNARKSPPIGSGKAASSTSKTQVRVTPERKAAMQQAGYWDDPEMRRRMLKKYAEYDRNNQTR